MTRMKKALLTSVAALALAVPAVAVSAQSTPAESLEGPDQPITGDALAEASAAAIAHLGEGTVTETEIEDEESYYEVEVTRDDGTQIDVQLDESFNVVGVEEDGDNDSD